jgi:rod shape-determining protein MreC
MPQKYLSKNSFKLVLTLVVCLGFVFFNPRGFFNPIRNVFIEMAYPFQKTFYLSGMAIHNTVEFFSSIGSLKKENEKLIKENNSLAANVALLRDEKSENENLREQLKLIPRDKFELEGAFVISQDPQRLNSWIMIDKGLNDGIKNDMSVIVSDGILIGKITDAMEYSSKITLLSSSESVINVLDIETGARGVLRGEYGLGVVMDMVSQQDGLNKDDTIITSGLGNNTPRGLLVGRIGEIRLSADKLFQQAVVVPRTKYSKLSIVFVVKN